ncbi:MAG: hypothetical protein P1V36_07770, partial [Planctomycetota bacterium]|nr:hypothetical protein [Planctomycetota bacterium]
TLRYTIFRTDPAIDSLYASGKITLGLASVLVGVALLQLLLYFRRMPEPEPAETVTAAPAPVKRGDA